MARGRKPRAIEVQEAAGSFKANPSRSPKNKIKADPSEPSVPHVIQSDEDALAVWNETVEVLRATNILSRTDTHLLTVYCSTYSEWVKLHRLISRDGHSTPDGKTSPESVAYFKLSAQHHKLMGELGLSPSSRARLSVAKSDEDREDETSIASLLKSMKG